MLLYIHGFRSTPQSPKAQLLKQFFGEELLLADHPFEPHRAVTYLDQVIQAKEITGLIASSLGGFYATYLSEKFGLPTVLINPSVHPYTTTQEYLGNNTTHDGVDFVWSEDHLRQLQEYAVPSPTTERYYLFLQTGDSILDYRVAREHYAGAKLCLEEGGNHGFELFEDHLKDIASFFDNTIPAT